MRQMRWLSFVMPEKGFLGSLFFQKRDSIVYFNEVKKILIHDFPDIKKKVNISIKEVNCFLHVSCDK